MAKTWLVVLTSPADNQPGGLGPAQTWADRWRVPPEAVATLETLINVAEPLLQAAAAANHRNDVITAQVGAAFEALITHMKYLHNHFFLEPELQPYNFAMLLLHARDHTPTNRPRPTGFPMGSVSYPGPGALVLRCFAMEGQPPLDPDSDYGYRAYWGVYPAGGASVEAATGPRRELMKVPTTGDELPHSLWTKRRSDLLDFHGDSGKTVYFCIRYENRKGEAGPWGPMFSAIIP
jgi:hypothetical protein